MKSEESHWMRTRQIEFLTPFRIPHSVLTADLAEKQPPPTGVFSPRFGSFRRREFGAQMQVHGHRFLRFGHTGEPPAP